MPSCKASLVLENDNSIILVGETPSETHEALCKALYDGKRYVQLTSAVEGVWNGREIYIRADRVSAILPPMEHTCDPSITIEDE